MSNKELDSVLSEAQKFLRDGYHDHLSAAIAEARNTLNAKPEPPRYRNEAIQKFWALERCGEFIARSFGQWTCTRDLLCATTFPTRGEAQIAADALAQEAKDRVDAEMKAGTINTNGKWFSLHYGASVVEVEIVARIKQ